MFFFFRKRKKKLGLALGGGVARGAAHIGVLQALSEAEIPIHYIAGTSAGSIVGGLFAAGIPYDQITQLVSRLSFSQFAKFRPSFSGLVSSKPMEQLIKNLTKNRHFKDLKIPFAAVATDLLTGQPHAFYSPDMEIATAIRASASFPGIFPPINIQGRYYIDGGASLNVPVPIVKKMGADIVLAIDVIPRTYHTHPPKYLHLLIDRGLDLLLNQISDQHTKSADLTLYPVTKPINSFELNKAPDLIEMGRQAVFEKLGAIKKLVR